MIRPIKSKIVVSKIENPTVTDSGIVLAGSLQEVDRAKVLAVGPEVMDVQVGDELLIDWQKASPTKQGVEQLWIINEEHVVAIFGD